MATRIGGNEWFWRAEWVWPVMLRVFQAYTTVNEDMNEQNHVGFLLVDVLVDMFEYDEWVAQACSEV